MMAVISRSRSMSSSVSRAVRWAPLWHEADTPRPRPVNSSPGPRGRTGRRAHTRGAGRRRRRPGRPGRRRPHRVRGTGPRPDGHRRRAPEIGGPRRPLGVTASTLPPGPEQGGEREWPVIDRIRRVVQSTALVTVAAVTLALVPVAVGATRASGDPLGEENEKGAHCFIDKDDTLSPGVSLNPSSGTAV